MLLILGMSGMWLSGAFALIAMTEYSRPIAGWRMPAFIACLLLAVSLVLAFYHGPALARG